jgi:hypothetical protein
MLAEKIHRKLCDLAPWLFACGLIAFVAVKTPLLGLPFFWDEIVVYALPAQHLFDVGLREAHPYFRANPGLFFGHPPAYATSIAFLYNIFGSGPVVARSFALLLACAGLAATYRLVARELTPLAGLFAALLLATNQNFFVQGTQVLADVALMSLFPVLLCLAAEARFRVYALLAIYLVLTKETGLTAIAAVPLARFLVGGKIGSTAAKAYLAPFAALLLYLADEKIFTGHFSNWPFIADNVIHGPGDYLPTLRHHVSAALLERPERYAFLWAGALGGLFSLMMRLRGGERQTRAISWLAWACVFQGIFLLLGKSLLSSVNEHYFIPLIPALVIGGVFFTAALWRLAPLSVASIALLFVLLHWGPAPHPPASAVTLGNGFEGSLAYVDVIRVQEEAVHYVQDRFPNATVSAAWPVSSELAFPAAGYVKKKVATVSDIHSDTFEVLVLAESSVPADFQIQLELIQRKGMILAKRFERNNRWVKVFVNPDFIAE